MAVESIQKDTGTQANIQLTRYKVMIQSRTSIDRLGLHEVVALVKPDTIDCFNFHESQLDLFFFLFPMTVYVDFFMVGAVFFVLLLFPHCSTFLSPEMLTQLLSSFFCFYFFWIYTITVLGGPAQLTTKVLRSTSFFGGLINDHEPNHLIHYESHSGIGKWQLQDQRRGFFLRSQDLRGVKRFHQRDIVLLVHNWTRKVYGWTIPAVLVIDCIYLAVV
jgi:hypothetical protein